MSTTITQQLQPAAVREWQDAHVLLYLEEEVTDPVTGQRVKRVLQASSYRDYLTRQDAYLQARTAFIVAREDANKSQAGRDAWALVTGDRQLPVKQAFDHWRTGGAERIERAIMVLELGYPGKAP